MAFPDIEIDLYDKLIERNRSHILRYINASVFFDMMREKSILSMNDVEEIQNRGYTRRDRAGLFLDKLQTKGNEGVLVFLDILEYEYAAVYKILTDKEAREPPPEYCKHRESTFTNWLYKLPQLAEDLKKDYELKKNLDKKLQEMEEILKFAQENNRELERDNEELRERLNMCEEQKTRTEKQLGDCMKEMDRRRDMSVEHLQNCVQFQQERDHYKEKLRDVILERDDLERQLHSLVSTSNKDEVSAAEKRKSFGNRQPKVQPVLPTPGTDRQKENLKVQIEILEDELSQKREKCEELSLDYTKIEDELDVYQNSYKKLKDNHEKLKKEKEKQDGWLEDKRKRIEEYFYKIEQLEQEKRNLEEERNKEQAKRKEEAEKSFLLFKEKHELENKFEELKSKHETLKVQCNRNSSDNSLPDESPIPDEETKCLSDVDKTEYRQFPTDHSNMLPAYLNKEHPDPDLPGHRTMMVGNRTGHQESSMEISQNEVHRGFMQRTDTVQANPSSSVRLKESLLEDKRMVDSGVFYIVAQHSGSTVPVQESDNTKDVAMRHRKYPISSLSCPTNSISESSDESDHTELSGFDVDTTYLPQKWKQFPNLNDSSTVTVKLNPPVLNAKLHIIGGNFTGIYISEIAKNVSDKLSVGDNILSVSIIDGKNYSTQRKNLLKGCTLEEAVLAFQCELDNIKGPKNQQIQVEITVRKTSQFVFNAIKEWMSKNNSCGDYFFIRCNHKRLEERLPDVLHVNRGDIVRVTNTHLPQDSYWQGQMFDQLKSAWTTEGIIPKELRKYMPFSEGRKAFRLRTPPFVRALPMIAKAKLPVFLSCHSNIVSIIQKMMIDDSPDYCLCNEADGKGKIADLFKQYSSKGRHILLKDIILRSNYWFINIHIDIENASMDVLRKLFGDVEIKGNQERIPEEFVYETVSISSQNISSTKSLLEAIYSKVKSGQERVYWMSEDKLDCSIAQQYMNLLGSEESAREKEKGYERSISTPS